MLSYSRLTMAGIVTEEMRRAAVTATLGGRPGRQTCVRIRRSGEFPHAAKDWRETAQQRRRPWRKVQQAMESRGHSLRHDASSIQRAKMPSAVGVVDLRMMRLTQTLRLGRRVSLRNQLKPRDEDQTAHTPLFRVR